MSSQGGEETPLVICSKSTWHPAIRREHSLAMLAAAHGHPVSFIERPLDVRALRHLAGAREWFRGLRGVERREPRSPTLHIAAHATILPGHLNGPGELTSNLLLRRRLRHAPDGAAVVVNVPWQWPATAAVGGRRVFDCADDWSALMGHRSARLAALYRRIGREADAIVVASESLAGRFPAERTVVVRNGVSEEMLGPLAAVVQEPRLVHAGTLTPRFDTELAAAVLRELPDWSLDLYGQCQYPGFQEQPGRELARLLSDYGPRVRWHGVLPRAALSAAIDKAAVALVLNRPEQSSGQDSMKLYDYAARGRAIVTTRFSERLQEEGPPHLHVVDDAPEMAAAILATRREPQSSVQDRRRWAERQRWESRWPSWSTALFGAG
jgi:glycosyltransferase involved in cell wall biosynthesis